MNVDEAFQNYVGNVKGENKQNVLIEYDFNGVNFIVTKTQELLSYGNNDSGQLGLKERGVILEPKKVELQLEKGEEIKSIWSKEKSTFIQTTLRIFACGDNRMGKLGIGIIRDYVLSPTQCETKLNGGESLFNVVVNSNSTFFETTKGRILACGEKLESPWTLTPINCHLKKGHRIRSINFGANLIIIETTGSKVYICGNNDDTTMTSEKEYTKKSFKLNKDEAIVKTHTLNQCTLIETTRPRILACGNNDKGKLGVNSKKLFVDELKQMVIPLKDGEVIENIFEEDTSLMIRTNDSKIYATGENQNGCFGFKEAKICYKPTLIGIPLNAREKIETFSKLNFGWYVKTTQHRLISWGSNFHGELGNGNSTSPSPIRMALKRKERIESVTIESLATFIQTNHSRIFATGYNIYGKLGVNSDNRNILSPLLVQLPLKDREKVCRITGKYDATIFETNLGRVFAAGNNIIGKLCVHSKLETLTTPKLMAQNILTNFQSTN